MRFAVALASVALATCVRLLLDPLLGDKFPYATLFLAVLATAWYGGTAPTIASVALGALAADYFLIPPRHSLVIHGSDQVAGMALFIFTSAGIGLLGSRMHSAQRRTDAVAESLQRKSTQLDQTFDAVLVWEWNGPISYWNIGAQRLYGFSAEQAVGRVSHDLLRTRCDSGIDSMLGQLQREGSWKGELTHTSSAGEELITESRMMLMRDAGGAYVFEVNRDVTEKVAAVAAMKATNALFEARVRDRTAALEQSLEALQRSEARAQDQERRFKLLVEGVRDYAIYMLDPEGRVTTWNAGAERNKGYRADEVLGRDFSRFFTPEDVESGKPGQELAVAERDGRFEGEGWRRRKDGTDFWAGVLLTAIRDDRDRLIGYAKITRDLTEYRRQQDLLVRLAEMAPCAMLLANATGQVIMVNAETERTFGYDRVEMLGRPLEMLLPARLRAGHVGLRRAFLEAPSVRAMGPGRELYGLRKDGVEFPIEIGLSPIESENGTSTLAAIFDITTRRRQQLETERALAEKETLLKEVYHRVKNNLQVVQSLLTLQRQSVPDGPARSALHDSVQRVRAMALVHEKLYQSGNLAAVSLQAYTEDLMKQIADANGADGRRVRLHADVPSIETGLDCAVPFGLLLTELVTNCLKHAFPERRVGLVRVSLVRQENGDLLTVADDGVGFADDFDPARSSTSLGLQLATGLARQLGGELRCFSDSGAVVTAMLTRL